ncbi:MAG: DUF4258 domain-containing protein [Thermodesulfovibrionales bacterium]
MKFEISRHALEDLERRAIPLIILETALQNPQQIIEEYGNTRGFADELMAPEI